MTTYAFGDEKCLCLHSAGDTKSCPVHPVKGVEMTHYPVLVRNQGFDYHDYTLRLSDNIEVRLTEQQVLSLQEQIDQDQKPISDEDVAAMQAALADIRAKRGAT